MIQSSLESLLRGLQLLCRRLTQILRYWRSNWSLKLDNFFSNFFWYCSLLLCRMYQKIGITIADFTIATVKLALLLQISVYSGSRHFICRLYKKFWWTVTGFSLYTLKISIFLYTAPIWVIFSSLESYWKDIQVWI